MSPIAIAGLFLLMLLMPCAIAFFGEKGGSEPREVAAEGALELEAPEQSDPRRNSRGPSLAAVSAAVHAAQANAPAPPQERPAAAKPKESVAYDRLATLREIAEKADADAKLAKGAAERAATAALVAAAKAAAARAEVATALAADAEQAAADALRSSHRTSDGRARQAA
jgi:hypothetical protein